MKQIAYLLLLITSISEGLSIVAPKDPFEAEAWYKRTRAAIDAAVHLDDDISRIKKLGDIVQKFGSKADYHPDPRWREVFDEAKRQLLLIPGHARYFADEIERVRLDPKERMYYDQRRDWYLTETLCHLPSPETVQVLGRFLDDQRDVPANEVPGVRKLIDQGKMEPQFFLPQNARLAAYSLSHLGLRDAPAEEIESYYFPEGDEHAKFRAWYAEVKEGKRPFSFLGQNVEYRFKPDGTWETTPLAISDETLREELKPPSPLPSAASLGSAESPLPPPATSARWLWVLAAAALLIAAGGWISRKRKR